MAILRSFLLDHIKNSRMNARALLEFLARFGFAALILKRKDDDHVPKAYRSNMPGAFSFGKHDPDVWGRDDQWLRSTLVFPQGASCPPATAAMGREHAPPRAPKNARLQR